MQFESEEIIKLFETFQDNASCNQYLAEKKWSNGYVCKKCGHNKSSIVRNNFSRECTKCHHIESPTAGTLFHKVKFGLRKAFFIVFEMSASSKGISSVQMSKRYGITQKTAWFFMQKVRHAMASSQQYPLSGNVQVDEFVVGQKEEGKPGRSYKTKKKKVVCAVEISPQGKIKRGYALPIDDYSSKSIRQIFENHISKEASVKTDEWSAYKKLSKTYKITQVKSENGEGLKEIHVIIQGLKSWLRTIPTHVSKYHFQLYLNEYFFRLNRSNSKNRIFDKVIERLLLHKQMFWADVVLTM